MKKIRKGGYLIAKVHRLTGRVFHKKLKEFSVEKINPAQGNILLALWQQDGISIQELASETSLKKNTLTIMLERLESQGFIRRIQSNEDKRKTLVYMEEDKAELKKEYTDVIKRMSRIFYEGFTEDEINTFENNLQRILNNLESAEKEILERKEEE